MGLKLRFGKGETIQGYQRVLSGANMADCYSYGYLALHATEILKVNKSQSVGRILGYCIMAARQIVFAKIRRDKDRGDRLPIGTISWGNKSTADHSLLSDPDLIELMGRLAPITSVLAAHLSNVDED